MYLHVPSGSFRFLQVPSVSIVDHLNTICVVVDEIKTLQRCSSCNFTATSTVVAHFIKFFHFEENGHLMKCFPNEILWNEFKLGLQKKTKVSKVKGTFFSRQTFPCTFAKPKLHFGHILPIYLFLQQNCFNFSVWRHKLQKKLKIFAFFEISYRLWTTVFCPTSYKRMWHAQWRIVLAYQNADH